jgi:L-aspartate oxidase
MNPSAESSGPFPRRLLLGGLSGVPAVDTDVLIVGAGAAGLAAALAVDPAARVTAIAKGREDASNTYHAQGGVAAVLDPDDRVSAHEADTLAAGAGLCDEAAVRKLVTEGPERVRDLIALGARFDAENGRIHLGSEGGHSRRRILHADGDRTGREIVRALAAAVRGRPNCRLAAGIFAVDLLVDEAGCSGALCIDMKSGAAVLFRAPVTILATGGLGQAFRETSNPPDATGDGVAMAFRAGADCADMEFVQFHPTVLYLAGAPRMLISEAVRGEGAFLLDGRGRRFMESVDPRAELAVRDVVARAIMDAVDRTGAVTLSLAHIPAERVLERFPYLSWFLRRFGLDMARDPIPVRPAAHYMMGGVAADLDARTTVPGLLACGECACTGVHGANRLASNSILEALVFGRQAGLSANAFIGRALPPLRLADEPPVAREDVPIDIDDMAHSLKATLWREAGLLRNAVDLARARQKLAFWHGYLHRVAPQTPACFAVNNMLTVGRMIVDAALARAESRGAHFRTDFPHADDRAWKRRLTLNIRNFE